MYSSKGPGDIYHIDGNDKLKPWGFCIHGCVDGFSRKIMWLMVSTSNNDPLIIANFFLQCVKKYDFCPRLLRMDKGRENIYCEDLQVFFTGDLDSYLYADSTRNQRIEAFWSRLKKFRTCWWIDFFKDMVNRCIYRPRLITHQECLLFCFIPIIQGELNDFARTWNLHQVRRSANAPGGKPDLLFNVPETVGHVQKGVEVDPRDVDIAANQLEIDHHPVFRDKDLHELLICYINIHNLEIPKDAESGLDMYVTLLRLLSNDGFLV